MKSQSLFKYLLLFCFFTLSVNVNASHIEGGEITWTCNGSGEFIFQVKTYKDCSGIPGPGSIVLNTDAPGFLTGIPCTLISSVDISPTGPGCPTCATPNGQVTAVLQLIYTSSPIVINGVPPLAGWYFAYIDCCRNGAITNLSAMGSGNFILRAIMYPFNNSNTSPCFDSSPQFAEAPTLAVCTGDSINYSHAAFDAELDSLVYEWAQPLDGSSYPSASYPFSFGYSYTSPIPSTMQNASNVPATMDSSSGMISFFSFSMGSFVTVTKVTSFKCGIKTAEIFREMQVSISPCPIGAGVYNTAPDIVGGLNVEDIYVLAGDTVFRNISATDIEYLSAANGGAPQSVTLTAVSPHLGLNDTSYSVGCLIPPCAAMSSATPITSPWAVSSDFTFPTACAHAGFSNGCLQHQRCFSFLFKFKDNVCPFNGITNKILNVYVTGPEIVASGNNLFINYLGASFQWCLNGVPIPGATDTIFTPTLSGIYTVIATNGSGCNMLSNAINRSVASVFALPGNERTIYVFPNPLNSSHTLNIQLKDVKPGVASIGIFDNAGRRVKNISPELLTSSDMLVLDISDLAAGYYSVKFNDKSGELTTSFVVQ